MGAAAEIRARVKKVLVQTLGIEEDEVTPSATLLGDLGAESIDCLDIVFRLEREFMIKIPRGELFIESLFRDSDSYLRDGRVTEEGLVALRSQMPYADFRGVERDPRLNEITDLLTVEFLVGYVTWKLEGHDESAEIGSLPSLVNSGR